MRSFVKITPSRNGEITVSFTDIGKSCLSRDFYRGKYVFLRYSREKNSRENFQIYSNSFILVIYDL